jgi:hypothetical protein
MEAAARLMTTCRSCKAEIVWARTALGKLMPVDKEPSEKGNVELVSAAGWPHLTAMVHGQPPMLPTTLHMPHHATCPTPEQFRK